MPHSKCNAVEYIYLKKSKTIIIITHRETFKTILPRYKR